MSEPKTKEVPQLNAQGLFTGPAVADLCPIDGVTWIVPGGAVDAPLPRPLGPNECARYAPEDDPAAPWEYLPDYSRATVYSLDTGQPIRVPPGWTLEQARGTLQPPEAPAPQAPAEDTLQALQARLLQDVAAKRWAVETGGITVAGLRVATGIEDQNRITSVVANAELAQVDAVDFKGADAWATLTVAQVRAVAGAVARHVQRCYSAERAHAEAVAALQSLDAAHAYDTTQGWPDPTAEAAIATTSTPTTTETETATQKETQ